MSKWFASAQDLSSSEASDSSDDGQRTVVSQAASVTTTITSQSVRKGLSTAGPVAGTVIAAGTRSKFMKNFEDSSDSEEEQRVVKTGQDKKREALKELISGLKNHLKINDFGSIMQDFERLSEEVDKSLNSHGGAVTLEAGDTLPLMILRAFIKIEDCINET